jgi:hypothetical protein
VDGLLELRARIEFAGFNLYELAEQRSRSAIQIVGYRLALGIEPERRTSVLR